jgi:hypothetical protein
MGVNKYGKSFIEFVRMQTRKYKSICIHRVKCFIRSWTWTSGVKRTVNFHIKSANSNDAGLPGGPLHLAMTFMP